MAHYGAATNLTDKLLIVPEGLGASIFPTMSALAKDAKDEAVILYQNYSRYVFMLGLPLAVGTTALAEPIILLIYGDQYTDAVEVLSILIWGTFFSFMISLNGWTLNAMHKEKIGALVPMFTTPIFLVACYFMVKEYGASGAAMAVALNGLVTLIILYVLVYLYVTKRFFPKLFLVKSVISVVIMFFAIELSIPLGFAFQIIFAGLIYAACVVLFRMLTKTEINTVSNKLFKKSIL